MNQEFRALQLEVVDLREEVESLRGELARLRRAVTGLRAGESLSSVRESDWESEDSYSLVSEVGGSVAGSASLASSGYHTTTPLQASLRSPAPLRAPQPSAAPPQSGITWKEREAIAEQVGGFLSRAISGLHRGTSGRERNPLPSRLWIIVRDYAGQIYTPVKVVRSWSSAQLLVKRGVHCGDAVFVGLPSEREGRKAIETAGLVWPEVIEP